MNEKTLLLSNTIIAKEDRLSKQQNYYIEPVVFVMTFAWQLAIAFVPNLLLKQACLHRGYDPKSCSNLNTDDDTKKIEDIIQPEVAKILMVMSINSSVIPGIVSLFVLPWSDKYGRKKVICATLVGHAASLGLLVFFATLTESSKTMSPWIYVIGGIPNALTGEVSTFRMATLCYITDRTKASNRLSRFFFVEVFTHFGMLSATALCSLRFVVGVPLTVIIASFTLTTATAIFTTKTLPEKNFDHENHQNMTRDLFSLKFMTEPLKTCFRPRPAHERSILCWLLLLMTFYSFKVNGTLTVFYLFLREKFNMDLNDFAKLRTAVTLTSIFGSSIGLLILKNILQLEDASLAVVAIISNFAESFIFMTAKTVQTLYIALFVCSLKSLLLVVYRSLISAHVPNDELGKVFSFTNFIEFGSTLIGTTAYTFVYSKTLLSYPGAFYLLTMGGSIISLILIVNVIRYK